MRQRFFHILFLVTALVFSIHASAQKALFDKYEDTNGVTSIYISKTMLGMIPNVKAGKHDIGNIASKLDYIRDEKVTIYQRTLKDGKNEFALLTEDKDEVTIINLMGTITLKDIKDIAGQH